jgi:hypothetical protein
MTNLLLLAALVAPLAAEPEPAQRPTVVLVVGAAGMPEYGQMFIQWTERWREAAEKAGARCLRIGGDSPGEVSDRQRLEKLLSEEPKTETAALWLVFVGHGTFDGQSAKFNLRGPDVTAAMLNDWLAPFERTVAVIDCSSSSAPFINQLSHPGRIVLTATKSGYEMNFARFGEYLAASIADPAADLDKDQQTSLLEAFLMASARTAEFYEQEARLATETPLVDDNGDALGTPAAWFRGIRAVRRAKAGAPLDGLRAHQLHLLRSPQEQAMPPALRARRDELERKIEALRESKDESASPDDYYAGLEPLVIELARLYAETE